MTGVPRDMEISSLIALAKNHFNTPSLRILDWTCCHWTPMYQVYIPTTSICTGVSGFVVDYWYGLLIYLPVQWWPSWGHVNAGHGWGVLEPFKLLPGWYTFIYLWNVKRVRLILKNDYLVWIDYSDFNIIIHLCTANPGCCWKPLNHLWHDDVIKWKHFSRYWPFVRGIHRSPVNSPHKGQWRRALMFSLICIWINGWVNNG